ncbi:uncharacterized protein LOC100177570 [Ciona intestinalis]
MLTAYGGIMRNLNLLVTLLVLLLVQHGTAEDEKPKISLNMDPVDVKTWGLPLDSKYPDVVQINEANFKPKVLESRDAWIVVVFKDKLHGKWWHHAGHVKGAVWYGSVDIEKQENFAKLLAPDSTAENIGNGVAVIFPFGVTPKEKIKFTGKKKKRPLVVKSPTKAEEIISSSIPNQIERMNFKPSRMKKFQDWVVDSYYKSTPPRFPLLCITDAPEPIIPVSMLVLSNYFSRFFSFALVRKDDVSRMRSQFKEVPEPKVYPHYLMLMGKEPSKEEMDRGSFGMHFDIFPFLADKYGRSESFTSVVKFLFTANEDYRNELPGRRSDEAISEARMSLVRDSLRNRVELVNKHFRKQKNVEL